MIASELLWIDRIENYECANETDDDRINVAYFISYCLFLLTSFDIDAFALALFPAFKSQFDVIIGRICCVFYFAWNWHAHQIHDAHKFDQFVSKLLCKYTIRRARTWMQQKRNARERKKKKKICNAHEIVRFKRQNPNKIAIKQTNDCVKCKRETVK